MRGITIYGDNVYVTTNEAHLMAFDARNGKVVWDTTIGDRSKSQHSTTSGPIAVKGKLIQGLGGCQQYGEEKCFISAYDAADRQRGLAFLHHCAGRRAGRRYLGRPPERVSCGRGKLDHRQLRS